MPETVDRRGGPRCVFCTAADRVARRVSRVRPGLVPSFRDVRKICCAAEHRPDTVWRHAEHERRPDIMITPISGIACTAGFVGVFLA
jgi:hypothetical protein